MRFGGECFSAVGKEQADSVNDGVGDEAEEDGREKHPDDEGAGVQGDVARIDDRNAKHLDFDGAFEFVEKRGTRCTVRVQPCAEFFLKEHDGELGHGVGDPTGGECDGNVTVSAETSESRDDHLERDGQHCAEETDGEAIGGGGSAGLPKAFGEEGFYRRFKPFDFANAGVA